MGDKTPAYSTERIRLEFTKDQYESTIARGRRRIEDIEDQKRINLKKAEIANLDLDDEIGSIQANEEATLAKIAEIEKNLDLMVKGD